MDPHADYRSLEGRHSGNGFSYAKSEGFLKNYFACCLHESYNGEDMLQEMEKEGVEFNFFDSILSGDISFLDAMNEGLAVVKNDSFGLELDCDSIQAFPSSAQTPSGISPNDARAFIARAAKEKNVQYLHLPEAAPSLQKDSREQVGKLLAYLVSDFIKNADSINA